MTDFSANWLWPQYAIIAYYASSLMIAMTYSRYDAAHRAIYLVLNAIVILTLIAGGFWK